MVGIDLNLYLWSIAVVIELSLLIHEYGIIFYEFSSFLVSFNKQLLFSVYKSYPHFPHLYWMLIQNIYNLLEKLAPTLPFTAA